MRTPDMPLAIAFARSRSRARVSSSGSGSPMPAECELMTSRWKRAWSSAGTRTSMRRPSPVLMP
ncbi:hypothetical protein HR12_24250 [Microbacterium sp. SUBG005]|nr:hypothetical protein HR12_24250 [Microbacterium sp. SUBG005]